MGFEFQGTIIEYLNSIKADIRKHYQHFENAWEGADGLKLRRRKDNVYKLNLINHQILKAGQTIDPSEFALLFKDGSIFSIAQTIKTPERNKCIIESSVVSFAKVNDHRIEYIFHYDKVNDIPNHPDFHLQFDYSPDIITPRFDIRDYVPIDEILHMIVRDRLLEVRK